MAIIKNLTPHPIHLLDEDNNLIRTFNSEGLVRLQANTVDAGIQVDGCKITATQFGEPVGLPAEDISYCFDNCRGDYDEGGFACPYFKGEHHHKEYCALGHNFPKTFYIVSQLVKSALHTRPDLLVPAEVVRDSNGNIIGCKSFGI